MGLYGMLAAFAAGYVGGMKVGDRPLVAVRRTMDRARVRASSLSAKAEAMRSKAAEMTGATVDIRHVNDVMSSAPETVRPHTTLREAAEAMQRADIGDVLVVDEGG